MIVTGRSSMSFFLLFPGQGAQAPGMSRPFLESETVRHYIARAEALLDLPLGTWMLDGPEAQLTDTAHAQPALLVLGYAVAQQLLAQSNHIEGSAGHSLGELTALAVAGAMSFEDAVMLAHARGRLMQDASGPDGGGMIALLGGQPAMVETLLESAAAHGQICAANDNAPGHIVASGERAAIGYLKSNAGKFGIRRAIALNVSAPFHSPLMQPAADGLADILADLAIQAPRFPVWSNANLAPHGTPEQIRAALVRQVTAPVNWTRQVRLMQCEATPIELPPGHVLQGLGKRIAPEWPVQSIGSPADLESLRESPNTVG